MTWFREWLHGDGAARPSGETAVPTAGRAGDRPPTGSSAPDDAWSYPGERFGLPETGPGSVATLPLRGAQFLLDAVLAGLVAALFTYPALPQNWSLLSWAALMVVPVAVIGATPAMVLLGIRIVRLDRPEGSVGVGVLWTLVRTVSLFFVIPGLIIDRDTRGVQDRVSRTVAIRTR